MRVSSRLLFAVAPPLAAAVLGGVGARQAPEVYAGLEKPAWAPPARVFGPVWSVLYSALGVAGWRIAGRGDRIEMATHVAQLAINASWAPLFFGAGRRQAALLVNIALDGVIAVELAAAARRGDRVTAWLLTPYLAWSSFATALTASVSSPERSAPR